MQGPVSHAVSALDAVGNELLLHAEEQKITHRATAGHNRGIGRRTGSISQSGRCPRGTAGPCGPQEAAADRMRVGKLITDGGGNRRPTNRRKGSGGARGGGVCALRVVQEHPRVVHGERQNVLIAPQLAGPAVTSAERRPRLGAPKALVRHVRPLEGGTDQLRAAPRRLKRERSGRGRAACGRRDARFRSSLVAPATLGAGGVARQVDPAASPTRSALMPQRGPGP